MVACNDNTIYSGSEHIPEDGWRIDSAYTFSFDITDTTKTYQVELMVRNTPSYQYQNLWLFIKQVPPSFASINDTTQLFLADDFGKWVGSGIGSIYSAEYIYQDSLHFSQVGTYQYIIRHGMRTDSLMGIHDIGLSVYVKE